MPLLSDMLNNPIGAVTYTFADSSSGTLNARWAFSAQEDVHIVCKGTAIPDNSEKPDTPPEVLTVPAGKDPFIGAYTITYAGPDGQESDPWNLLITRENEIYYAVWSKNDVAHYHGIGFVSQGNLICGWRPVT
ncbi:hypothetical protein [Kiloniella majae]|uniref:hypothetical protein n=1 Tax=Kiloniella majae TaxID=1938558 RepID=UPI000A2785BD|nr:hypothetical protein [Kiloniella majae]